MSTERKGPLKSVKVIEISNLVAGPFCANLMADYGADVIKIEMPGAGDPVRLMGPKDGNGASLRWPTMGRNKRPITLDLRRPEGRDIFLRLVKNADIVVENFRPGTIEKWGIGFDEMKKVNPKIVLVRISGYGQEGPYSSKAGFGTVLNAFSGYTALQGFEDRAPVSPSISLADFMGGMSGFIGGITMLTALARGDLKEGQVVDATLYEPLVRILDAVITDYKATGRKLKPSYMIQGGTSPCDLFKTKDDKWVLIVASNQNTWSRIPPAMGRPELVKDPRFIDNDARMANNTALMDIFREWFSSHDYAEIDKIFTDGGVVASMCYDVEDMFNDPQYKAREDIVTVKDHTFGDIQMTNIFPFFSGTPCEIRHTGLDIGACNEDVYKGDLGLSDADFVKMKEAKII